jgi:sugar phosphate isomerase/epimerase
MKIGIDSYCFHRFFGEVYPEQPSPPRPMSMDDFLAFAHELKVDGVSLESCFFPSLEASWLRDLKSTLDGYGFDRVYAWGHPDGLEAGQNSQALDDMIAQIPNAALIGAPVMRVVGSSLMFRHLPHRPQLEILAGWFKKAALVAEQHGVKLAVENHIDYTAEEILWLVEAVDSPAFGVNFDTGNFLRLLDDPIAGMEKLATHTLATHIKDLKVRKGVSPREWFFFSSTPVGDGLVDNEKLARILEDSGYQGFLAVEIDHLHPDYNYDEHAAVRQSVEELRRIAGAVSV